LLHGSKTRIRIEIGNHDHDIVILDLNENHDIAILLHGSKTQDKD